MRGLWGLAVLGVALAGACATSLTRPEPYPSIADPPSFRSLPRIVIAADSRLETTPNKLPDAGPAVALLAPH